MRFELFLTKLPQASVEESTLALAALPKGAGLGVIVQSLKNGTLPTVCAAFSAEKHIIDQIEDVLNELGAECHVRDNGTAAQKVMLSVMEQVRGRGYSAPKADDYADFIRLKGLYDKESVGKQLTRHALRLIFQLTLVEMIYVTRVALNLGVLKLMGSTTVLPEMMFCALGVIAGYVGVESISAMQKSKLAPNTGAKLVGASFASAVVATGFMVVALFTEPAQPQMHKREVRRESNPFAGLVAELRYRKFAHELEPTKEELREQEALERAEEGEPICEENTEFQLLDCLHGPSWDELLACFAEPTASQRFRAQLREKREREQKLAKEAAKVAKPAAMKRKAAPPAGGIRMQPVHIAGLLAAWGSSILMLMLWYERRVRSLALRHPQSDEAAEPPEAATLDPELLEARRELAELPVEFTPARTQAESVSERHKQEAAQTERLLAEAHARIAELQARIAELQVRLAQPSAPARPANADGEQATLQHELKLTRAALAISYDKLQLTTDQLAKAHTLNETQGSELARLHAQLRPSREVSETGRLGPANDQVVAQSEPRTSWQTVSYSQSEVAERIAGLSNGPAHFVQSAASSSHAVVKPQTVVVVSSPGGEKSAAPSAQEAPPEKAAKAPATDVGTGTTRGLRGSTGSSYSVGGGQEERITPRKRGS